MDSMNLLGLTFSTNFEYYHDSFIHPCYDCHQEVIFVSELFIQDHIVHV